MSTSQASLISRGRDAILFSGLWPAAVAVSLVAVCHRALGGGPLAGPLPWGAMGLAATGTLLVYNVDRLRDLARDQTSSPARSAFVQEHRGALLVLSVLAGLVSLPLAVSQPPLAWAFCGLALGLGLLHRRLKDHANWAVLYVTAAWLAVVVGLPAAGQNPHDIEPRILLWVTMTLGLLICANLLGSELRGLQPGPTTTPRLQVARVLAAAGSLLPSLDPSTGVLVPVGASMFLALVFFRFDERYGLGVLDGALLLGALLGLAVG